MLRLVVLLESRYCLSWRVDCPVVVPSCFALFLIQIVNEPSVVCDLPAICFLMFPLSRGFETQLIPESSGSNFFLDTGPFSRQWQI